MDGRMVRAFRVFNDHVRECLCTEIDFSLPTLRVLCALDWLIEWCGKPEVIRFDNGLELISHVMCGSSCASTAPSGVCAAKQSATERVCGTFNCTMRREYLEMNGVCDDWAAYLLAMHGLDTEQWTALHGARRHRACHKIQGGNC